MAKQTEKPAQKKLSLEDLAQVAGGRLPDGIKYEISGGGTSAKYETGA